MRITDIHHEPRDSGLALCGSLTWEDTDRPARQVYFAAPLARSAELSSTGNAFLAGCYAVALHHGERRLRIDAPCCPWLENGLQTIIATFNHWFYGEERRLAIEHAGAAALERQGRRTAMFLSGGIDSLFALWDNSQRLPQDHPGRVREAIVLRGFEIQVDQQTGVSAFDNALESLRPLAAERGVQLTPLITNLRQLDPDGDFWGYQLQGGLLAAAAHALAPRFTDVILAASSDVANLKPYGTHPAIDAKLSSCSLTVHHEGERYTRVDKVRQLAAWPAAIDRLRVCSKAPAAQLNCGRCEKCVRCMLELLVTGQLRTSRAFSADDLTPRTIEALTIGCDAMVFYPELLEGLRRIGRYDLARPLAAHLLRDLPRRLQSHCEEAIKDLDQAFNRGRLRTLVRRARSAREAR